MTYGPAWGRGPHAREEAGVRSPAGRMTLPEPHTYAGTNPRVAIGAAQWLTLLVGLVYTAVGAVGVAVTGWDDIFGHSGERLLGLEVNPFHNVVHLAIGLAGLACWSRLWRSYVFGWVVAAAYGAVFVYGLVATGESWDVLALDWADSFLHVGSALVGVAIAVLAWREDRRPGPPAF